MSPLDVNQFDELSIGLATAANIRSWSSGEVKKPETINYRTLKPEKDGLFCEKIFGPQKAWECACGKYKRVRFKGIVCERCGVEVTSDKVRRDRMGHIALSAPVVHIWYLRGTRSWLAYLLMGTAPKEELKAKQLEKVIYFAAHMITFVDVDKRHEDLSELRSALTEEILEISEREAKSLDAKLKDIEARAAKLEAEGAKDSEIKALERNSVKELDTVRSRYAEERELASRAFDTFEGLHSRQIIEDEVLYREMEFRYGEYFKGGMGADAILQLIDHMDLDEEEKVMREMIDAKDGRKPLSAQRHAKFLKRLAIVQSFNRRDEHGVRLNDPRAMILEAVPVIPPDLRPMVQLDGGRFATSDLNDLYRRVINRNNRLKRSLDLGAPDIIVNNEKRMLQEAVDALFDNGRRGRPVAGQSGRPLKSLSDMLKGKQGRFRQNLLGKRVDYSGRSVIVVGPTLKLHQCGLPKMMALELFKPFVMKRLIETQVAQNIKSAKRMVERRKSIVWDVLEEVIREHPVLLNRAPTLHRLGIQAFEPILVDGKAIQIHPLVCKAFNADFDGDQMAVHVPLSAEAQAEARILMLSTNNIFTPATGRPITEPAQDMVFGAYYLTNLDAGQSDETLAATKNARVFRHVYEIENALADATITLHAPIEIRPAAGTTLDARLAAAGIEATGANRRLITTPGRVFFNEALPTRVNAEGAIEAFAYVNVLIGKNAKPIGDIVLAISEGYGRQVVAESLDAIKNLGFKYATKSGLTISINDVVTTAAKKAILEKYEEQAAKVELNYRRGVIVDDERRQQEIEIWTNANKEVGDATDKAMNAAYDNPIRMMVDSGARGNSQQIRQIAAMKGLVSNPRGEMIPRPIKSSFREGLSVLEYFISTHGTRKGLGDTALRTADSGYLTRRLVDVAQELIVKELDCGTTRGMWIEHVEPDTRAQRSHLATKLWGRVTLEDIRYRVHFPQEFEEIKKFLKISPEMTAEEQLEVIRLAKAALATNTETRRKLAAEFEGITTKNAESRKAKVLLELQSLFSEFAETTDKSNVDKVIDGWNNLLALSENKAISEELIRQLVAVDRELAQLKKGRKEDSPEWKKASDVKKRLEVSREILNTLRSEGFRVFNKRFNTTVNELRAFWKQSSSPSNSDTTGSSLGAATAFYASFTGEYLELGALVNATKNLFPSLLDGATATAMQTIVEAPQELDRVALLTQAEAFLKNNDFFLEFKAALAEFESEWKNNLLEFGTRVIPAGTMLEDHHVSLLRDLPDIDRVRVRTTLTCDAIQGVCAACYGLSLATHKMVELGEAVGVIAAQSIGEPGTQLTMRTFHSGGVSDSDITHGLPRVVELFEARTPKGAAKVAEFTGCVSVELIGRERKLTIVSDKGEIQEELIPIARHLLVEDGQEIKVGTPLHDGPLDPKTIMNLRGVRAAQQYLVEEVQNVYRDQGVSIHDKHIELIVRQMTCRVQIVDPGKSPWLPGDTVLSRVHRTFNEALEGYINARDYELRNILVGKSREVEKMIEKKKAEISKYNWEYKTLTEVEIDVVRELELVRIKRKALEDKLKAMTKELPAGSPEKDGLKKTKELSEA